MFAEIAKAYFHRVQRVQICQDINKRMSKACALFFRNPLQGFFVVV